MVHRTALLLIFASALALSAQAPDVTVLPMTRVVLYKSGVGYFEHVATVTGNQSLAVQFTGDQLDDVLKSLTAVDLGSGRVSGVSYDSPTPAERRLRALRVPLTADASTLQVLQALRGSRVEVRGEAGTVVTGRVLQVERRLRPQEQGRAAERDELTLVTDLGDITTVDLGGATRVRMADADLRQDVGRYLDIASSNSDRSQRRVVLSTIGQGARQVLVSYVGEAAVWKTTYRLLFPSSGGQPTLQGWALVDNVSAADWENVELSLVAGAPQAFRQPLSTPLFATRPLVPLAAGPGLAPQTHAAALTGGTARLMGQVRDHSSAPLPGAEVIVSSATGGDIARAITNEQGRYDIGGLPTGLLLVRAELAGFQMDEQPMVSLSNTGTVQRNLSLRVGELSESVTVTGASPVREVPRPRSGDAPNFRVPGLPPPPPPAAVAPPSAADIEAKVLAQSAAASGADLGDLFEYKLADRVTIRRNQSALVPILQTAVAADRVSLWNDSMGLRPRRAVWLRNTSQLTLDAGSLSIVEGGAFGGEGLIEPLKPNERRLVTYAADLGVQLNAQAADSPTRVVRLRAAKGVVTQESEQRWRRTYTVRNDDRDARAVIVEHPVRQGWTLSGAFKPEESTPTVHRFRVTVPAAQTFTFDVNEVRPGSTTFALTELHRERLRVLIENAQSREQLERSMAPVFAKSGELDAIETDLNRNLAEQQQIADDQSRIRENVKALGVSAAERRLTERYTRQLEDQENRVDVLKKEQADLTSRQARAERELNELIAALTFDVTP